MSTKKIDEVPLWNKVLLTLDEASKLTGIGVNSLRDLTNDHLELVVYVGSKRLIKRQLLVDYLNNEDLETID